MPDKKRVLITDYAWPDLEIERRVLSEIDAELVVADQHDEQTLVRLAEGVDAIMTCWAQVPSSVIGASENLRIVGRFGIGLDNIDVSYCTERNIPVTNVPDYCQTEVAEHTLALLLALARNVTFFHQETKAGKYDLHTAAPMRRIAGQSLGIVGFGRIGKTVAEKARAVGLKVLACTRSSNTVPAGVELCEFDELIGSSDYITLHLPLSDETRHMIGSPQFAAMKSNAYLINTARGDLIDHEALARALNENQIAGAALDVQSPEPPDLSKPPYNDPRVIVTPHAAFVSTESVCELRTRATRQIAERLCGRVPENVVNDVEL